MGGELAADALAGGVVADGVDLPGVKLSFDSFICKLESTPGVGTLSSVE